MDVNISHCPLIPILLGWCGIFNQYYNLRIRIYPAKGLKITQIPIGSVNLPPSLENLFKCEFIGMGF